MRVPLKDRFMADGYVHRSTAHVMRDIKGGYYDRFKGLEIGVILPVLPEWQESDEITLTVIAERTAPPIQSAE